MLNQAIKTSDVSTEVLQRFEERARSTYPSPTSHPYHNWPRHITDVLNFSMALCDRLELLGLKPNRTVVYADSIGHDVDYANDHVALGFSSKEEMHARKSAALLRESGADEEFSERVAADIHDTEKGREPRSLEAKILRAADLHSLTNPFKEFKSDTDLLLKEYQNARGRSFEISAFVKMQLAHVLADYLATTIYLTPESTDAQGRSQWHIAALENIQKQNWQASNIALFSPSALPKELFTQRELAGSELILGVTTEKELRQELAYLRSWQRRNGAPALVVPGNSRAASIPSGSCDETHMVFDAKQPDMSEALRITQPDGRLYIYLRPELQLNQALLMEYVLNLSNISQLFQITDVGEWKVLGFLKSDAPRI